MFFMDTTAFQPEKALRLTGWGRYPAVRGRVRRPEQIQELREIISADSSQTVLARGAGRSYGDAAVNPGGATVLTERLNRILGFDDRTGVVRCEAGVTFDDLLRTFLPRGWFPAVTPGTRFVTVGGAVAGDVHGKNHHRVGSFHSCVRSVLVMTATGEALSCSPTGNDDLFLATVGGVGLTGIIQEVELALRSVETAYVTARDIKAPNLDEAIGLLQQHDASYEYSVAWVNTTAEGRRLGESIVSFGNHAAIADLDGDARRQPLTPPVARHLGAFIELPSWTVNPVTIRAFNALYFGGHHDGESVVGYDGFFYPLDRLHDWNRIYGRRGFVQYQCAVPEDSGPHTLRNILEHCQRNKIPSSLGVLKRFGPAQGWLSFPIPGYTLSLDIPFRPGILAPLDELDRLVIQAGGRVNLSKDARLSPQAFRAMYPEFPRWLAVKRLVDPLDRFSSAMGVRLQLAQT
jgi:decaprenylphospho-beta-D-ribofuranose 2-oxidase